MARANGSLIQIRAKTAFRNMREFTDTVSYYGQRKTMQKLAHSLQHEITRYVPVGKTKNLQRSYIIDTGRDRSRGPWFKLEYLNTEKAPYTMYQYYGKVWENNFPIWQANIKLEKSRGDTHIQWQHIGWMSRKGVPKHETNRPLGTKGTIKTPYGMAQIKGYTKKKPKPKARWVEWYCDEGGREKFTAWQDITGQRIVNEMLKRFGKKK